MLGDTVCCLAGNDSNLQHEIYHVLLCLAMYTTGLWRHCVTVWRLITSSWASRKECDWPCSTTSPVPIGWCVVMTTKGDWYIEPVLKPLIFSETSVMVLQLFWNKQLLSHTSQCPSLWSVLVDLHWKSVTQQYSVPSHDVAGFSVYCFKDLPIVVRGIAHDTLIVTVAILVC